jgi:hypothetical protein
MFEMNGSVTPPDVATNNLTNINSWNTSNVQTIERIFANYRPQQKPYLLNLNNWNLSSCTTIKQAFFGSYFNGFVDQWYTENVVNMEEVFRNSSFNRSLSAWNVSNVTTFVGMFSSSGGSELDWVVDFQGSLHNWNLSSATSSGLNAMLLNNFKTYRGDISSWCVPNIPSTPFTFINSADLPSNIVQQLEPLWGTCPGPRPIITSFTVDKTVVNEGEELTFTVTCNNNLTGSFYWRQNLNHPSYELPGVSTSIDMFDTSPLAGFLSFDNGVATFTLSITLDNTTEGNEFFRVDIYSRQVGYVLSGVYLDPLSTNNHLLASSPVIRINANNT